jgi:thiol-disulfide isomerase/thioredoxin
MAKHGRTHKQQARVQHEHPGGSQKQHEHHARPMRKPVRRTPAWVAPTAAVGAIALVVVAFLAIRYMTTPAPPVANPDTTASVISTITSLSGAELDQVGQGSATNVLTKVNGSPLTGAGGKPVVFYYGAEYCPYCAAMRWPMIIALSRFGTFSGLSATTSSSTDVYPNTVTFTFHGATYTSDYIEFQSVESTDRNQNPLESPSTPQQALISKYDTSQTIPFVDIGNRFVIPHASYQPDALQGMSWQAVADALKDPQSTQAAAVLGSANLITAAICSLTSNQPSTACTPAIQALEAKL